MTAKCVRSLVILSLLNLVALQSVTANRVPWRAKLGWWKARRAIDPGNFGVFCRPRLFGEIAGGRITLLLHDKELGARDIRDRRSKFVVIRSRSASDNLSGERVLGIPTSRSQPVHLHDVDRTRTHHLGRMLRGVLTSVDKIHPRSDSQAHRNWSAAIHMPLSLTMPVLHIHGQFAPTLLRTFEQPRYQPKLRRWRATLDRLGYSRHMRDRHDIYASPRGKRYKNMDVVAVAPVKMKHFLKGDKQTDALIGKMILDVADFAIRRGTTLGYIAVERDSHQVVAKVVTGANMTPAP